MTRDLTVEQLAAALGVSPRTLRRWIDEGCPADAEPRRVNDAEVRVWCAERRKRLPPAPARVVEEPGAAPPVVSRATLAGAELARRLTVAHKNQLELAAEKGLKDHGLDERIRAAQTHADLLEYTKRVMELVGSGAMTPERGRTLQGLAALAGRHMKARSEAEGGDDAERLILTTEEGGRLVAAFEGIVSDASRAACLAFVEAAGANDLLENPNVDLAAHVEAEPEVPPAEETEEEQTP